jgi:hypothetical protein
MPEERLTRRGRRIHWWAPLEAFVIAWVGALLDGQLLLRFSLTALILAISVEQAGLGERSAGSGQPTSWWRSGGPAVAFFYATLSTTVSYPCQISWKSSTLSNPAGKG